jgi:hypothetical protein
MEEDIIIKPGDELMSISDTSENAILALIFNATTWANYAINATTTPETNIICALHTADPGDAGTQSTSEATYSSYARVNVARTSGGWTISGTNPTQAAPVAAINFPAGTGGSGTVTYFSTGKSGGGATPILFSGTVTPNIATGNGVTPSLSTASTITLD